MSSFPVATPEHRPNPTNGKGQRNSLVGKSNYKWLGLALRILIAQNSKHYQYKSDNNKTRVIELLTLLIGYLIFNLSLTN